MTYAFTFDASACSGCKACQIACKDKNNLPTGVLWRRVFEVSGGSWTNIAADGARLGVWQTDVFAYNLSIACNHCVHPKCAGVCPTDAYIVRPDGIVYIDESKCMGCGYCAWACPYAAPKYNPDLRHMTKCNFCFDNLDAGLPPACVAACPMRVLDYKEVSEERTESSYQALWQTPAIEHPFPLPAFSRTEPHLAIKPHVAMHNGLAKVISNRDETQTQSASCLSWQATPGRAQSKNFVSFAVSGFDELSLVIFTLAAQMAAGVAVFSLFFPLSTFYLLSIGFLLGFAGLASILHLGTPMNAWRAVNHLKKSWLSREILMFGLFGGCWLVALVLPGMGKLPLALTGLGLVYSMAQVYRLRAAPAWNSWRTQAAFFLSAGVLGLTGVAFGAALAEVWFPLWALLAAETFMILFGEAPAHETAGKIRVACLALAVVGVGLLPVAPEAARMWLSFLIILLIFAEEALGRWLFYEMRQPAL